MLFHITRNERAQSAFFYNNRVHPTRTFCCHKQTRPATKHGNRPHNGGFAYLQKKKKKRKRGQWYEKHETHCSTRSVCGSSSSTSTSTDSSASTGDTAAADTSASTGDKVKLTLGSWTSQPEVLQDLIDAYEAENPNVEIDIQITPYKGGEYWTKLEASAGG